MAGKFIANIPNTSGGEPYISKTGWEICKPADYCATVEKFLDVGHKFVKKDLLIGVNGNVISVESFKINEKQINDDKRYVLKAKALEEKEALEAIEQVEWEVLHGDSWHPCM